MTLVRAQRDAEVHHQSRLELGHVNAVLLAIFVMKETLQEKNRTPISWDIANPFKNLEILWRGPENITGYRSTTLFRRLAFTVFIQVRILELIRLQFDFNSI